MARKCCGCDTPATHIELFYVNSADDYYCGFCHAETYYYADFAEGYQMAEDEIASGDIDARAAVYSFEQDPPDCARHWGYLQACIHEVDAEITKLYGETI